MAGETTMPRPWLALFVPALALFGCGERDADTAANADLGTCDPFGDYAPVPLQATPPLPNDACADPPGPISTLVEAAAAAAQAAADATAAALLDPATITVVTCGTGNPLPSDRAQSCTAVFAGGQFLLFDSGDGAQQSMEDLGLPITELTAVFLTHFHSDHIADLGETISRSWILGRTTSLPVYGGPSVERVIDGFNLVYSPDELYRTAHHGATILPPDILPAVAQRIDSPGVDGIVVYDVDGVVVKAYTVDHSPVGPSLGYRVGYGGRSVGISGDTIDVPGFRNLAQGADVLVSEVLDSGFALDTACALERIGDGRNSAIMRDIRTYHISVDELGPLAEDAGVGTLVLTHMVPAVDGTQAQLFFAGPMAARYSGELILAEDGTQVTLSVP